MPVARSSTSPRSPRTSSRRGARRRRAVGRRAQGQGRVRRGEDRRRRQARLPGRQPRPVPAHGDRVVVRRVQRREARDGRPAAARRPVLRRQDAVVPRRQGRGAGRRALPHPRRAHARARPARAHRVVQRPGRPACADPAVSASAKTSFDQASTTLGEAIKAAGGATVAPRASTRTTPTSASPRRARTWRTSRSWARSSSRRRASPRTTSPRSATRTCPTTAATSSCSTRGTRTRPTRTPRSGSPSPRSRPAASSPGSPRRPTRTPPTSPSSTATPRPSPPSTPDLLVFRRSFVLSGRSGPSTSSSVGKPARSDVHRRPDVAKHFLGVLDEHLPGEAQHHPAFEHQRVLPPTVALEEVLVGLVQAPVDLDGQLQRGEGDVDVVDVPVDDDLPVGLPARDPGTAQQSVGQPLGLGPGFVAGIEKEGPPVLVATPVARRSSARCRPSRVAVRVRSAWSIASPPSSAQRSSAVRAGTVIRRPCRSWTSSGGTRRRSKRKPGREVAAVLTAHHTGPRAASARSSAAQRCARRTPRRGREPRPGRGSPGRAPGPGSCRSRAGREPGPLIGADGRSHRAALGARPARGGLHDGRSRGPRPAACAPNHQVRPVLSGLSSRKASPSSRPRTCRPVVLSG